MLEHLRTEPTSPERAVILGASGFVGAEIRARLETAGIPVSGLSSRDLDLLSPGAAAELAAILREDDVLVFVSAIAPCKDVPTLMKNLHMAEAVCEATSKVAPAQIIYISSDAVYGALEGPLSEESPADPASLHGAMHRSRELMLRSTSSSPLMILRPSLLYGASDPHGGYGPNRFRRSAQEGGGITLFGEGEEKRDHVFVRDVAELVLQAALQRSQGILNIATGDSTSFRGVAEQVAVLFEGKVEVRGTPRQNPITHCHFDVTAIHKAFPRFRPTSLADGLALTHHEALAARPQ